MSTDAAALEIADQIVPEYRMSGKIYSCTGNMAKRWTAAYEAAKAMQERCAKVAEREWRGVPLYPDGADIAKDIRSGEQP